MKTATTVWLRLSLAVSAITLNFAALAAERAAEAPQGSVGYTFEQAAALPAGLGGHAATLLDSGRVLVAGGQIQNGTYQATCYLYDAELDTWTTTGSLTQARRAIQLAHLADGDVLAVGGSTGNSSPRVERYDLTQGTWSEVGSMMMPRDSHAVVVLQDGSVLAVGGRDLQSGVGTILNSAERFNPVSGQWQSIAPMSSVRMNLTATLLGNGEVLVAGGFAGTGVGTLASAEIYNPGTNTWRPAAAMPGSRLNHTGVPLASGEIILVGGNVEAFGAGVKSGLIYNPGTDQWRTSAESVHARRNTTVTRLNDGKVAAMAGGSPTELSVTQSTEIYDPTSDSWIQASPMIERRYYAVSSILPNGDVLIIGGQRPTPSLAYMATVERMVVPPDTIFAGSFEDPATSF